MPHEISVIIPAYNAAGTIRAALDSVIAQTRAVSEIIVVDDGSTDATEESVQGVAGVTYLYQANRGPSAARNRGIREARGELIAFLDADDAWLPQKMALQAALFENDPGLGLCASSSYLCSEDFQIKELNRLPVFTHLQIWRKLVTSNLFTTPTVMVRRACFERVGLFDESFRFGEDWDMWLRIGNKFTMGYIDQPLCHCRMFKSSITRSRTFENLQDWQKLIELNRIRLNGWYAKTVGHMKAMSWFSLNCAHAYRSAGQPVRSASHFMRSICYWPFWLPLRYAGLICLLVRRQKVTARVPHIEAQGKATDAE